MDTSSLIIVGGIILIVAGIAAKYLWKLVITVGLIAMAFGGLNFWFHWVK